MKIAFHSDYAHPLPEGHRFPMEKYALLPQQILHEGIAHQENFFEPDLIDLKWVEEVHCSKYIQKLIDLKIEPRAQRKTGFEHSKSLVERELRIMEGTRKLAEFALSEKVGLNIAGGTHHAYSNRGEGFCLLNDQAIASNWLLKSKNAERILIIDLDVHQGNGTAEIFQNEPNVFTFSMHGKNNYPLKKEQSDWDIELEDNTSDNEFLSILEKSLVQLTQNFQPDFLFFQSGVDVLSSDKLGRLGMTIDGCKKRDELVFELADLLNLPIVASMGGGYSPDIKIILEAHTNTFRVASNVFI